MTKKIRRHSQRQLTAIVITALLALGLAGVYVQYRLGLRPVVTDGACTCDPVNFSVKPGQNAQTIASNLKAAGLIRDRNAFITYVNIHGLRPRLKVGTYQFTQRTSASDIADTIAGGKTVTRRLTVPEGYRLSQIESAAAADLGISKSDFQAALATPHAQAFLAGVPQGVDLEGYLFPDTYEVTATTTAPQLVNAMLDNFGRRVGPEYVQAFAAEGLTLHQGLTLASIIEREVNNEADRPIVAQIFLKRFRSGMPLGSDVTAQYASDLAGVPFNVDIDSHYNTRRYPGFPPGPICSPGLSSLDAAAHPATTDYLYFLSGKDGKTYFAKTYAEHQANIAKHL